MSTINIKRHDTKGKFVDILKLDGNPINLSGATIKFVLKKPGLSFKRTAVITNAIGGAVEYQPVAEDVAQTGRYKQEWEVVFADTQILTVPNGTYNVVNILIDLG